MKDEADDKLNRFDQFSIDLDELCHRFEAAAKTDGMGREAIALFLAERLGALAAALFTETSLKSGSPNGFIADNLELLARKFRDDARHLLQRNETHRGF